MSGKPTSEALSGYWQQQIDNWQVSGQSQQAFCKTYNLIYHQFLYWRRKLKNQSIKNPSPPSPALVPVIYRAPSTGAGLSLALPNGLEFRGLAEDNLSLVEQLLDRLS